MASAVFRDKHLERFFPLLLSQNLQPKQLQKGNDPLHTKDQNTLQSGSSNASALQSLFWSVATMRNLRFD
jgi:hypothetical protein